MCVCFESSHCNTRHRHTSNVHMSFTSFPRLSWVLFLMFLLSFDSVYHHVRVSVWLITVCIPEVTFFKSMLVQSPPPCPPPKGELRRGFKIQTACQLWSITHQCAAANLGLCFPTSYRQVVSDLHLRHHRDAESSHSGTQSVSWSLTILSVIDYFLGCEQTIERRFCLSDITVLLLLVSTPLAWEVMMSSTTASPYTTLQVGMELSPVLTQPSSPLSCLASNML